MDTFDPRNQTFFILGRPSSSSPSSPSSSSNDSPPVLAISLPAIDAQRVRLANTSINYGVQLGLCLSSLLVALLLLPPRRLRRAVHLAQLACLLASSSRLVLLVLYFPGPLTEYYVAWTRDAGLLRPSEYGASTASAALGVVQLALVEAALALQSRVLVRTWGAGCRPGSSGRATAAGGGGGGSGGGLESGVAVVGARGMSKKCWWRPPVLFLAVLLAAAAVGVRAVWVAHYTKALRGHTLPVPLDAWGRAAVIIGAMSVFYFCGIFFAHLVLHLAATRRVLRDDQRLRKFSITLSLKGRNGGGRGGLTSLEILAVGNGILMLAPCLFAGLDIAAGPGNTRVLPFDAGSWVQTLVAAGLPLISIAAFYRGSDSADSRLNSRVNRLRTEARWWPDHDDRNVASSSINEQRRNRRASSFLITSDGTLPFSFPPHAARRGSDRTEEEIDTTTLTRSSSSHHPMKRSPAALAVEPFRSTRWSWRVPPDVTNTEDLEAGITNATEVRFEPEHSRDTREKREGDDGKDIPA
ncbi:cross-pathway control WD-repeat protein cpc2 [Hypoxylon texense]